ncbi:MAG TPA: SbcC/MukB-like Walker B domain-containing protein, partial [Mycobacteriales bacterium]
KATADLRLQELAHHAAELDAALVGLRRSAGFQHARELTERAEKVESLARSADNALSAAGQLRDAEQHAVSAANDRAADLVDAARALGEELGLARTQLGEIGFTDHTLPATFTADRRQGAAAESVLRLTRVGEPERIVRPVLDVVTIPLDNPDSLRDTTTQLAQAADLRARQAANRAKEAEDLVEKRRAVQGAADKAQDAEGRAEAATEAAQAEAENRDRQALALAEAWRSWCASADTADLFGTYDWHTHPVLGTVLVDPGVLCGDPDDSGPDLTELDRSPDEPATTVRNNLVRELARLEARGEEDDVRVAALEAEQARLRAAHDPEPPLAFWRRPATGVPLWRCLDFADGVPDADRAGIEAALLASGLLTATVDPDGRLTAEDGHLLLTPANESVRSPLTSVLSVDPAAPLPPGVALGILSRIGYDDPSVPTWVGADGRWGNGPLRGRHTATLAQHIGATARAAARARRLADIDTELTELANRAAVRAETRAMLAERQQRLSVTLRSAPRSARLLEARSRAGQAARHAAKAHAVAAELRLAADRLARDWAEQDRRHRVACAEFGLPTEREALDTVTGRAGAARDTCARMTRHITELTHGLRKHADSVRAHGSSVRRRADAEDRAAVAADEWRAESTMLDTMRRALGEEAAKVQREISQHDRDLKQTRAEQEQTRRLVEELSGDAGVAAARADNAAQNAQQQRDALGVAVTALLNQLGQPGVADTALTRSIPPLFTDPTIEAVNADVATLLAALSRAKRDENTLIKAQQTFERSISENYDVVATVAADLRLFALVDSSGQRPLAHAAAEIARRCEEGRAALTTREQRVFTEFILGEVGEELRRRLTQADRLVRAMNTSLRSIRTSHGIGVRLTWKLAENTGGNVARIKELVATAASVRTDAQDAELTELLAAKVAAEVVGDPTASYAVHLRNALDYRSWHNVEVIITGPEPGRERHLRRRAKLSQGETRFVSYVTLFAAVEAYLSGLDNTGRALRLILLDDAFAKVDEPTIAELLGLLVRLDVDFAMTGHALWGCVPQVPKLDVYEICREEGSPAVTVHVHWDGRNQHFLRST